jgi:predicted PurR-regulated permease PerM
MQNDWESRKPFNFHRLIEIAYLIIILSAFSLAKEFLLPIILAILISFLLMPAVSRLERWHLHPILAVLSVVVIAFALIGMLCATLSVETLELVNSLPKYRENINSKWTALQKSPPGPLGLAVRNIGQLVNDFSEVTATTGNKGQPETEKVQIISGTDSAVEMVKQSVAPVVGPSAEFVIVVVLVIFILLERKLFRERFLLLIGHSHMATTTLAVDEAGTRLSSFLLMQLAVNSGFAVIVGIGLTLIGIPNAILWAVLTLVLRFLPYVGLWISAFFPLALSIAISNSWSLPILTLLLYVVLEVFTNNVIEPFVLGGSTGMSPLAVIISAMFWTWIWGPIGLLLATPITACLVVLGRYFPAFYLYSVLLSARPPTSSEAKLIRLLTENRLPEAKALLSEIAGMQLSMKTAEQLLIPTIRTIENELFPGAAANQTKSRIYEQMRDLIEELAVQAPNEAQEQVESTQGSDSGLVIAPVSSEGDELIGRIIARLLEAKGINSTLLSWKTFRSEKMDQLKELQTRFVLLSATEPRMVIAVTRIAKDIQDSIPDAVTTAGLWSLPRSGAARLIRKIRETVVGGVYTDIEKAIRGIASLTSEATPSPQPDNQSENVGQSSLSQESTKRD